MNDPQDRVASVHHHKAGDLEPLHSSEGGRGQLVRRNGFRRPRHAPARRQPERARSTRRAVSRAWKNPCSRILPERGTDTQDILQKPGKSGKAKRIRSVPKRMRRTVVHFEKETVDAGRSSEGSPLEGVPSNPSNLRIYETTPVLTCSIRESLSSASLSLRTWDAAMKPAKSGCG